MSTTSRQPYSPEAAKAAREAQRAGGGVLEVVDAMHDRSRLGLAASVCARTFLHEIVDALKATTEIGSHTHPSLAAADWLLREFEARP
jgi:hypothetical protein